jgi:hypothetical protein
LQKSGKRKTLEEGAGNEIHTCMEIEMYINCVGVKACMNRKIREMHIFSVVGTLVVPSGHTL